MDPTNKAIKEQVCQNTSDISVPEETTPGPIGIEIGAVATLIATGYSGHVERTYRILDKDITASFDIPK